MKLVVIFVCACVAGSLGSFLPAKVPVAKAGLGVGKVGENRLQRNDNLRDVKKASSADQKWVSADGKKAAVDQDWESQSSRSGQDATHKAQAHRQHAAGSDDSKDASNRAASKAAATSGDKSALSKLAKSSSFDQNQAWSGNDGFRKKNLKHEGISYSFDKKHLRNANENGGFNAGHSLDQHALDDNGHRRSSYDRVAGDHAAQAARGDRQSADRSHQQGENAWSNAGSADKFGHDYRQAAGAHANNRDWAEKNDRSANFDGYNADERARASDVLHAGSNLDRNAQRQTAGFGATSKGLYGKGAGVVAPVGFGYKYPARKIVGDVGLAGKGLNLAKGGADSAKLWDSADQQRQQATGADALEDRRKSSSLANQWQGDQVKGFDSKQGALLDRKGYDRMGSSRANAANAANRQWADANAAKGAQQARHDLDEVARLRDNAQWARSDRDRKVNEWKKFFNNDKKGGQNWERLKYNKDQTEDTAAGDFANRKDAANRWQDAHRYDVRDQAAHGAESARARDAANRAWSTDNDRNAAAAARRGAQAQEAADRGLWGASNDRRKSLVDQSKYDARNRGNSVWDQSARAHDYDANGLRGAKGAVGGKAAFPAYNSYYSAYPANGGYYNNYGAYPYNNNAYGGYYGGYGPSFGVFGGAYH